MCLYIQNTQFFIAPEDIRVRKYLTKDSTGQYRTPIVGTPVTLGETLVPNSSIIKPEIEEFDVYSNPIYSIHSGVIHASITHYSYYGPICVEAIIPKGTKF